MRKIIVRRPFKPWNKAPGDLHPVLRRVYAGRGIFDSTELDYSLSGLCDVQALSNIRTAVELLAGAVRDRRRILIVGDFDADGATSCALAVRALRAMGAEHVDYLVPNRFEFGYGLTPEIVAVAAAHKHPDLIVTVDNGISSVQGVAAAQAHGIRVLITDHHLPGRELPRADAIVNPNQPGDPFPSKHLAGVGVIFYVMSALRAHLRDHGWFGASRPEPNMAQWLDLVALGTVADVVPLDRNNRILVSQGVRRIRAGLACPGIQALLTVAGRDIEIATTADLGFAAAPRLNAAGRLSDMGYGIECLLVDDARAAREHAIRLDALNRERREIEQQMHREALDWLEQTGIDDDGELPFGVCLFEPNWHEGVVGIVASRIKERVHRPVIAFARTETGELKGSARSIGAIHIRDTLDHIAACHPGMIRKFGGHAMAAGLTIPADQLEAFRLAFDAEIRRRISADELSGVIYSDGELEAGELSVGLARLLRDAAPWGHHFPEPVFDGSFEVRSWRVVSGRHVKMAVAVPGFERCCDAIAFHAAESFSGLDSKRLRLAYRLGVNRYRGANAAELVVEHFEADCARE